MVGLVHGQLKPEERDEVMRRFRAGEVQVLVATTVIEVGIDVPNATIMVVEHPERFGLAQLHQLAGPGGAGRGRVTAFCSPGRRAAATQGVRGDRRRLPDRGAGPGGAATGRPAGPAAVGESGSRWHANLAEDADLLGQAKDLAREIVDADPMLTQRRHALLKERALGRYPRAVRIVSDGVGREGGKAEEAGEAMA